jgi:hypothetical protein
MANKEIFYKGQMFTVAIVDDEDQDILNKSWFINTRTKRMPSEYFQLRRNLGILEKAHYGKAKIYMHHEIWIKHFGFFAEGMTVDHIDFDTANNKKSNLRLMTNEENRVRHQKQGEENAQQVDQTATGI